MKEQETDIKQIKQWGGKPVTLQSVKLTPEKFCQEFADSASELLKHHFLVKKQKQCFKSLKATIGEGEFIVQRDFSQNYAFVVQNTVSGFHCNNSQATVYTVAIWYRENNSPQPECQSLAVISECLSHDPVAVYVFTKIIIKVIKSMCPNPKKIYYQSDRAPQQYKNFKNFVNLYFHEKDFGIPAEWHFSPTAHGKGAPDGIGGSVKRLAARASLHLPPEEQIVDAQGLYNWAQTSDTFPSIQIEWSSTSDYNIADRF